MQFEIRSSTSFLESFWVVPSSKPPFFLNSEMKLEMRKAST